MDAQAGMLARLFEHSMGLGEEWRVEDVWFESPESGDEELHIRVGRVPGRAVRFRRLPLARGPAPPHPRRDGGHGGECRGGRRPVGHLAGKRPENDTGIRAICSYKNRANRMNARNVSRLSFRRLVSLPSAPISQWLTEVPAIILALGGMLPCLAWLYGRWPAGAAPPYPDCGSSRRTCPCGS